MLDLPRPLELFKDERDARVGLEVAAVGQCAAEPRLADNPGDVVKRLDDGAARQEIKIDIGERHGMLLLHRLKIGGAANVFFIGGGAEMDGAGIVGEEARDGCAVPRAQRFNALQNHIAHVLLIFRVWWLHAPSSIIQIDTSAWPYAS